MELYRIEPDDMTRIEERDLEEEEQLETRLVRTEAAQIGGIEILYIGRQGSTESGGIFDILGVDRQGNTVVVELKRGEAPRSVISQALEYASEVRNAEYSVLNTRYQSFLREEQEHEEGEIADLQEAHADHFDLDDPLSPREFNNEQRLIVVGAEFTDDVLLNMADFLRSHGIDVVAVEYNTYRDDEENIELLTTDAIRRPLSQEPSTSRDSVVTRSWKEDGESWHLEQKSNPKTAELLQNVVEQLTKIDYLKEPKWGQKDYIAFADDRGERRFVINTGATIFRIKIRETVNGPEERKRIADRIGVPENKVDRISNYRDDPLLRIRIDPEYDIDINSLREEVENLLSPSSV